MNAHAVVDTIEALEAMPQTEEEGLFPMSDADRDMLVRLESEVGAMRKMLADLKETIEKRDGLYVGREVYLAHREATEAYRENVDARILRLERAGWGVIAFVLLTVGGLILNHVLTTPGP